MADSQGREEARKLHLLPDGIPAPRLRWLHDADDWVVLGFEYVEGRAPLRPWVPMAIRSKPPLRPGPPITGVTAAGFSSAAAPMIASASFSRSIASPNFVSYPICSATSHAAAKLAASGRLRRLYADCLVMPTARAAWSTLPIAASAVMKWR